MMFNGPLSEQRAATAQFDPLNRKPICPPNTSKFNCRSLAELPAAPPQPWLVKKSGVPEGRVEKQTLKSTIQKIDRPFSVYTPAGYKTDGPPNALLNFFRWRNLVKRSVSGDDFEQLNRGGQNPAYRRCVC